MFDDVEFNTVNGRLYILLQGSHCEILARDYSISVGRYNTQTLDGTIETFQTGEISMNADFILIPVEEIPKPKPKKPRKVKRKPRKRRLIDV